jgi:hypothetical protein
VIIALVRRASDFADNHSLTVIASHWEAIQEDHTGPRDAALTFHSAQERLAMTIGYGEKICDGYH